MNLSRRCCSIGPGISSFATKTLRSSAVSSRAALHTPAKRESYPAVSDISRITHLSKPTPVRTLFHRWFTPKDYIDLSDARGVVVSPGAPPLDFLVNGVDNDVPYIMYWRTSELNKAAKHRRLTYFPFPVNTRGFLYFWQHPTIPLASGLRFRIAQQPSVQGFLQGRDLQTPYGGSWHLPLIALASSERFGVLNDVLQKDGYVPPQLLEYCAQLKRSNNIGQWSQFVFFKGQPFYLDLGAPRSKIFLVGPSGIQGLPLDVGIFAGMKYPFKSGVVLCRFETRPSNSVAMRVLRVIEPVKFVDQYEGGVDQPQPGQLVTVNGHLQLFLSKSVDNRPSPLRQWQYDNNKDPFAWSWSQLQRKAGEGWKFPWLVKK
ncbi:hypothetical protein GSI_02200 [Ganoderma sinense ZZ0214-1]|uniref:Uncharacterized protein n=1 Tax=Ganoderma sinense ZZ0214-1 TaxID=1077348 RepID=A0A2G8SNZ4_9APHY|nr:hypothetical protein GSI_02200 [Ganoderma sinense ZZ0214-1]